MRGAASAPVPVTGPGGKAAPARPHNGVASGSILAAAAPEPTADGASPPREQHGPAPVPPTKRQRFASPRNRPPPQPTLPPRPSPPSAPPPRPGGGYRPPPRSAPATALPPRAAAARPQVTDLLLFFPLLPLPPRPLLPAAPTAPRPRPPSPRTRSPCAPARRRGRSILGTRSPTWVRRPRSPRRRPQLRPPPAAERERSAGGRSGPRRRPPRMRRRSPPAPLGARRPLAEPPRPRPR